MTPKHVKPLKDGTDIMLSRVDSRQKWGYFDVFGFVIGNLNCEEPCSVPNDIIENISHWDLVICGTKYYSCYYIITIFYFSQLIATSDNCILTVSQTRKGC